MVQSLERTIRNHLRSYLRGDTTLGEFQTWFIPRAFASDESDLADAIELVLAEFTSGHRTEDDVRQQLASIAEERDAQSRSRRPA